MRISIWRQFASNHSNDFTLVGQFPSPESAQSAAEELRTFLAELWEWHQANPGWYEDDEVNPDAEDSPPEDLFRKKYIQEWDYPVLDWRANVEKEVWLEAVQIHDDLISVEPQLNTWRGHHPFTDFLKAKGARTAFNSEMSSPNNIVGVMMTGIAPNQHIGMWLRDYVNLFSIDISLSSLPWIFYVDENQYPEVQALKIYQEDHSRLLAQRIAFRKQLPDLYQSYTELKNQGSNREAREISSKVHKLEKEYLKSIDGESPDWYNEYVGLSKDINFLVRFRDGIVFDKNQFAFEIIIHTNVLEGIKAIVAWLTDIGCTDVEYSIHQLEY